MKTMGSSLSAVPLARDKRFLHVRVSRVRTQSLGRNILIVGRMWLDPNL